MELSVGITFYANTKKGEIEITIIGEHKDADEDTLICQYKQGGVDFFRREGFENWVIREKAQLIRREGNDTNG